MAPVQARELRKVLLVLGAVAGIATALFAGALLGSPLGPELAAPGPVSGAHATLVGDCGTCHAASPSALKGPLYGILESHTSLEESAKCGSCHALGEHALEPHGIAPASFQQAEKRGLPGDAELSCATCHHEHQGRDADLTALGSGRCQSCHANSFESIADGHPEFGDYPYVRRLSIAFDHVSHVGRHFRGESQAPATCMDCHTLSADGGMSVQGFDATCGSCHAAEVAGHGRAESPGVPFLGLPAVDTLSLEEAGIFIGQWPADAEIAEGTLTPISAMLLAGDPRSAADVAAVSELDWLDLSEASDKELAAVGRVVWDLKSMLAEVAEGGHAAMQARFEGALGEPLDQNDLAALVGSLSVSDLRGALDRWLPGLAEELQSRRRGVARRNSTNLTEGGLDDSPEEWVTAGGWYRDDYSFTLYRRPCGHADPFLEAWTDLSVKVGTRSSSQASTALFQAFTDPSGPGRCTKCHSIDAVPSENVAQVHWREGGQRERKALVHFSHAPHVKLLDDEGCQKCHGFAEPADGFRDHYAQGDPTHFQPSFAPMEAETCASCHAPQVAGGDCLDCHAYHGERPQPGRLQALPALQKTHSASSSPSEAGPGAS
jgi:hypothetical protein